MTSPAAIERHLVLGGKPVLTSALGFGGNRLAGALPRADSLQLLETAYQAGIRYFDVARAYGMGDAEGIVGEFLRRHSSDAAITVATKFGLQPPRAAARARGLISFARGVARRFPGLRKTLSRGGSALIQKSVFTPEGAQQCLTESLRELGVEHIPVYLLHDPALADCGEDLWEFLHEQRERGVIGEIGVGTSVASVQEIIARRPEFARIAQFESSALRPAILDLPPDPDRLHVTYGAVGGKVGLLGDYLDANPDAARHWKQTLDVDASDRAQLSALLLSYAVHTNPRGVVLFSSTRQAAIAANVRALAEARFSPAQLDTFGALAQASGVS